MAKKSKKANQNNIDPVKAKLGFLIFLTVVLIISSYVLFTKNSDTSTLIIEPIQIESTN
jgi:hypothetical protein